MDPPRDKRHLDHYDETSLDPRYTFIILHSLAVRRVLTIIGRENPSIEAIDPDDNRKIFLYVSGRNALVPLSEKEYLRYNSIGGRKVLEDKQSYYEDGRGNRDEEIMREDIERKIMVVEALLDTAKKRRTDCGWLIGGPVFPDEAVFPDERTSVIEKFKLDVEDSLMNAQKILNSLRQEYLQLYQENGMTSLREFQTTVQDLETQLTREKDSWGLLVSE